MGVISIVFMWALQTSTGGTTLYAFNLNIIRSYLRTIDLSQYYSFNRKIMDAEVS